MFYCQSWIENKENQDGLPTTLYQNSKEIRTYDIIFCVYLTLKNYQDFWGRWRPQSSALLCSEMIKYGVAVRTISLSQPKMLFPFPLCKSQTSMLVPKSLLFVTTTVLSHNPSIAFC